MEVQMFHQAKNGIVEVNDTPMDYVVFGKGQTPLVMLPGLTDGLKTVREMAFLLSMLYKDFAQQFRVYMFSRKAVLEQGCTTKDMARDLKIAFDKLGITRCHLLGVSQGGMIAQRFAIDYPEMVSKLVIAVSSSRPGATQRRIISKWIGFAKKGDYKALMIDTAEHTYSPEKIKSYRKMYPIITRFGKPKDFSRFLIQAEACLIHNTYDELDRIECPTLVVGGKLDQIVGSEAAKEMADRIRGSKLLIYDEYGHAAYEESKDFNGLVVDFLLEAADCLQEAADSFRG
jgi:pimeloyl-ACP methyl ester carboxylesterase